MEIKFSRIFSYKKGVSSGSTLIEAILAVAVIAIVIPAIVVLGIISLNSTKNSSRRNEASKIASAGIEAIKYVRDQCGFEAFPYVSGGNRPYLKLDTVSGTICNVFVDVTNGVREVAVVPDLSNPDNKYLRTIELEAFGTGTINSLKVNVTVKWGDGSAGSVVHESAIINNLSSF